MRSSEVLGGFLELQVPSPIVLSDRLELVFFGSVMFY